MKSLVYLFTLLLLSLSSCNDKKDKATQETIGINSNTAITSERTKNILNGMWEGIISNQAVLLSIEKITPNSITGFDKLGNQKREFSGTFEDKNEFYKLSLKETEREKNNGEIRFTIDSKTLKAKGQWSSYDGKFTFPFVLEKTIGRNTLTIKAEEVNLRSAPNTDSDVIFQLKRGNVCEIIEKGKKDEIDGKKSSWYKVHYKDKEGWVFGSLVRINPKKN